jgi:hypothetical protein
MISPEQEALILRLFHAEKWRVGTIADQLGLHRDVVMRVLKDAGALAAQVQRPSLVDPYIPFITETFKSYPDITAARLYDMVKERGYTGHISSDLHRRQHPPSAITGKVELRLLAGADRDSSDATTFPDQSVTRQVGGASFRLSPPAPIPSPVSSR